MKTKKRINPIYKLAGLILLLLVISFFLTITLPNLRIGLTKREDISLLWRHNLSERVICTLLPIEESIVIQTTKSIFALDLVSGIVKWRTSLPGNKLYCYMSQVGGNIFVSDDEGSLYSINASTGQIQWKNENLSSYSPVESIVSSDRLVFVARLSSYLTAMDITTGEEIWKQSVPNRSWLSLEIFKNTIFLAGGSEIAAYDPLNGDLLWKESIPNFGGVIYDDGNLFGIVYYQPSQVFAYDLEKRRRIWQINANSISDADDILCFTQDANSLYVSGNGLIKIDKQTGNVLWKNELLTHSTCPVMTDEKLYVRQLQSDLYILEQAGGNLLSRVKIRTNFFLNDIDPIVSGNTLFFVNKSSEVNAISIK